MGDNGLMAMSFRKAEGFSQRLALARRRGQAVQGRSRPPRKSSSPVRVGCFLFVDENALMAVPFRKAVGFSQRLAQRDARVQAVQGRSFPLRKSRGADV